MKEVIRVGSAEARPGEHAYGYLELGYGLDGQPLRSPVHIIRGEEDGPVLWAQGACHGDEYDGTRAMLRLIQELTPADLKGTLIALPVANLSAYNGLVRESFFDKTDLNRVYPGSPEGSYSQQLAHQLLDTVSSVATHFVEHHGGGHTHDVVYYTLHCSKGGPTEEAAAICEAMGAETVWASADAWLDNSLFHRLHTRGIPAILIECGGEARLKAQNVQDHYDALRNMMIHLGMLPGQERQNVRQVRNQVGKADFFFSQRGGLIDLHVKVGDVVTRGQLLASIVDFTGETVEDVRCRSERAVVLALRTIGTVTSGGSMALLGEVE